MSKNNKKSKNAKKLILMYSVLGALVVVLLIVAISKSFTKNDKDISTYKELGNYSQIIDHIGNDLYENSDTNATVNVIYINIADISRLDCISSSGVTNSVAINHNGDAGNDLIYLSGSEDQSKYSANSVSNYVGILTDFSASSAVKNPGSLSEYGLDNPQYTLVLTLNDGKEIKINIGNRTPAVVNTNGCYFSIDGIDGVFITAAAKLGYCERSEIDFLDKYLFNFTNSDVTSVEFTRNYTENSLENCTIKADASISNGGDPKYSVYEPYNIEASSYFAKLVEKVVSLEISSFLEISDDELADYGLLNPTYTFKLTLKTGDEVTIFLSEPIDDIIYGKCTGVDHYFRLSRLQLDGIDTPLLTLLSSYVSYYNVSEITCINCTYGDKSFAFDLDVKENLSISDSTSIANLNLRSAKVCNSDGRSYAAMLFESLVCVKIGGIDTEAQVTDNPEISLTFCTRDYTNKTVDFVKRDDSSYYVFIDGKYTNFYVYSGEIFKHGGDNTFDYGFWTIYEITETAISEQVGGVYDIPSN